MTRRTGLILRDEDRQALQESCSGGKCGACCGHVGYPPFIYFDEQKDEDWYMLSELKRQEILDHIDAHAHLPDGTYGTPCLWYDETTRCCKNYFLRPQICRDFEVGSQSCLDIRATVTIMRKLNGEDDGDR